MHTDCQLGDTGAAAPFPQRFVLWADSGPTDWPPDRDLRIASALRIRIDIIDQEIAELEDARDRLSESLRGVQLRIARNANSWGRA
jgi:hypothetical protein